MRDWALHVPPEHLRLWKLAAEVTEKIHRHGLKWICLHECGVAMTSDAYLLPWWPWRADAEQMPTEDAEARAVPTPLIASTIRGLATKKSHLTINVPEWAPGDETMDFDVELTAPRAVSNWMDDRAVRFTATVETYENNPARKRPPDPSRPVPASSFHKIVAETTERLADEAADERVVLSPKLARQAIHLAQAMNPPRLVEAVALRYGAPLRPVVWTPHTGDDLRGVIQMPMRGSES